VGKLKAKGAGRSKVGERAPRHIAADLRPLARPIMEAQPDPANENVHDEASVAAIAASLDKYSQRTPIVVNKKTGLIAKGEGTWRAARKLGWTTLAMVFVADDPRAHTGYRLADNRTAQLAHFDDERLAQSIATLKAEDESLFAALQLDALEATLPEPAADEGQPAAEKQWAVLVECETEKQANRLFDRLAREGFTCKLQTL
jgi:ParB-like chromosome segregation protein Spo0J